MVSSWSVLKPVKESLTLCKFLLPVKAGSALEQWVEEKVNVGMALRSFYRGEFC